MAGLGPAQQRLGLGLALAEPGRQGLHRLTVGRDPVDRGLQLIAAHAEGSVRGDGADQVAARECRLPGGQPTNAEEVHRTLHVEAARLQRTGLAAEYRLHRFAVEPDARGTLVPSGEEILSGGDLVLALARVERGHLAPAPCGDVIRGRSGRRSAATCARNSRRWALVMPTTEKQPLPSTTVEMPSSRTRRSRHSAWAMAPAAAACWYRGSLCS